jgi:hypothetical protein
MRRATTRAHPLSSSKAHALGDTPASEFTRKSTAGDEEPLAAGPSVVPVNWGRVSRLCRTAPALLDYTL